MTQRKTKSRVSMRQDYTDVREVPKERLLGSATLVSSQDMKEYIKANRGVPLQNLSFGEQIMIDVSEAVGKFLAIGADVQGLYSVQQAAMKSYADSKSACMDWYRRMQKECRDKDAEQLYEEAQQRNKSAMQQYNKFVSTCMALAALHQTIFDKPMRIFRMTDIYQNAGSCKTTSGAESKQEHSRQSVTGGSSEPSGMIEEPLCALRSDGSVECILTSHFMRGGCPLLDLSSILRVKSRMMVRQDKLNKALSQYQTLLNDNKKLAHEEYRNSYQACQEFLNLRGKVITAEQWRKFQKACTHVVAARKVLHNKDIPYKDKEGFEKHAAMVQKRLVPDSEFAASVLGEGSTSRQSVAAHNNAQLVASSGSSGGASFVRTAKAQELYGQWCLLGDENTEPVQIQFRDIAHEPDITLLLKSIFSIPMVVITNGNMLTGLLVKARHRCQIDREGAELLCSHLLEVCIKQDPIQLADFVKIGDKKSMKDYEQLMEDGMEHLVLKCVLERKPIDIMVGRGRMPSFDKADVVFRNKGESDRTALLFMGNPFTGR